MLYSRRAGRRGKCLQNASLRQDLIPLFPLPSNKIWSNCPLFNQNVTLLSPVHIYHNLIQLPPFPPWPDLIDLCSIRIWFSSSAHLWQPAHVVSSLSINWSHCLLLYQNLIQLPPLLIYYNPTSLSPPWPWSIPNMSSPPTTFNLIPLPPLLIHF